MPTTFINYYGAAGKINLLPIRAVSFYEEFEDINLTFFNLESESSYKFVPKTRRRSNGSTITLGYDFEGNYYIPHNQLDAVVDDLAWFGNKYYRTQIALGNAEDWELADPSLDLTSNIMLKSHNSTSSKIIDLGTKISFSTEIESVELRPRTILRQKGFIPNNDLIISTFTT
jgi:hypothetical protein